MNSPQNEMKLIIPKGCDNAPRKQIVIDFTIAIWKRQNDIIMEYADESIVWFQLKEDRKIEGLSAFISSLEEGNKQNIDCLEIHQVITHGKSASINGVLSLTDGTTINFCDVYLFSNTARSGKVKELKTYKI
ncbi:hypothetical protein F9U64_14350 [Gracilibacillus oryzae]|uniref:Nuclear transport factor 2 family protein n=1 Tax=Gracilibacillus oryzae TaxID=1672701 RepID=A0A7C8KXB8_9BACI|nr:hypothetical protein [Gracilibacillus oryzae]KAB8130301.1 hypothetical protein F9U64_14350 [Gracilibacillus oryzae]